MPGRPQAQVDVLVGFDDPLLELGGTIEGIGDLRDANARRTIDATGLYLVPFDPEKFSADMPAYFNLTRDPDGRDVAWTLAGDVDPAARTPALTPAP